MEGLMEKKMKIEIYTKKDCVYCVRLKELFNFHGIGYIELEIGNGYTREEIQERVGEVKKINVVPQLFVNDEYIGGYLEGVLWIAYDRHMEK